MTTIPSQEDEPVQEEALTGSDQQRPRSEPRAQVTIGKVPSGNLRITNRNRASEIKTIEEEEEESKKNLMQRITTLWREQASLNPASQRIPASFACIAKDDAIEKNPQAIRERRKMGEIRKVGGKPSTGYSSPVRVLIFLLV